jgi:hypothetical protein
LKTKWPTEIVCFEDEEANIICLFWRQRGQQNLCVLKTKKPKESVFWRQRCQKNMCFEDKKAKRICVFCARVSWFCYDYISIYEFMIYVCQISFNIMSNPA